MASRFLTDHPSWRRAGAVAAVVIALGCAGCIEPADSTQLSGLHGEGLTAELARSATSFVVKFAPTHPLGRAQAMEGLAAETDAEAAARTAVELLPELQGLCFDQFTQAGAEVVLSVCEATSFDHARDTQALWLARLTSIEGVERVTPLMNFVQVEQQY